MASKQILLLLTILLHLAICNGSILMENNIEDLRLDMIIEIITHNWKNNGWTNIYAVGNFTNSFFNKIHLKSYSFSLIDFTKNYYDIRHAVPHHSNTIIINCSDFVQLEVALTKAVKVPYWHPLSNIILYYHSLEKKEVMAKMFFIFWYLRAINVIIIQYSDSKELLLVSHFNPYACDKMKFQRRFGCWTAKKLSFPIDNYEKSVICEEGCNNVPLESKRRVNNLGTCVGFDTYHIPYNNKLLLQTLRLVDDENINLHGCPLRAFAVEVLPFLEIREYENGSFTLHSRDGMLWNTMAERMNFTIDLSLSIMKKQFNFEISIRQLFAFIQRKVDLLLYPLYQFDLVVAEVDNTVTIKESGVCFVSRRAGFETTVFNVKFLQKNLNIFVYFTISILCTWFVFFIFSIVQLGRFSFDQVGKDLLNTFKTILSITLNKPSNRGSFRIFLIIAIWGFFIINFSTQAIIVSIFSAFKRDKDVDTIEDVLEKGYPIEGVASPDIVLPEDDERYRMINSRRVPIQDLFGCVNALINDSHKICVVDCGVGRYLERNRLNSKGQQYLHVATHDRIHSHYLNMIFHRHSPLTATYNKIALAIIEAGIIKKWEQYRFNDIKEDAPVKPMTMEDILEIYKCYGVLVVINIFIFFVEVGMGFYVQIKIQRPVKLREWKDSFLKKIRKGRRKMRNMFK